MSLIGSVGGLLTNSLNRMPGAGQTEALTPASPQFAPKLTGIAGTGETQAAGFGQVFDKLVGGVDAKQTEANQLSRQVLLGQNDQLHQSVIAMQEASVAFTLMVEVRNKLVESYQELMRMPV